VRNTDHHERRGRRERMAIAYAVMFGATVGCHPATKLGAEDFDQIRTDLPPGTSDLTLDEHEHLWAIAERAPMVAEIVITGSPPTATIVRHPLDGVPAGVDTEALAYLGNGRFAIGTEGHDEPSAQVLFGQLGPDGHIALTPGFSISSEMLGVQLRKNHGVEALCGTRADLVVGIETVGVLASGARYAPIVRVREHARVVQRLLLTTDRGKLSALTCTISKDGTVDLLAIERNYGVTRLLHAQARIDQQDIRPEVVVDLWPMIHARFHEKLNLEGIARLRDGRIVLVNDNEGKGLDGPTWLFVFRPH